MCVKITAVLTCLPRPHLFLPASGYVTVLSGGLIVGGTVLGSSWSADYLVVGMPTGAPLVHNASYSVMCR